jgi:hypothetical protein
VATGAADRDYFDIVRFEMELEDLTPRGCASPRATLAGQRRSVNEPRSYSDPHSRRSTRRS